jgi:Leucine-rich repeat (LRR) protein
LRLSNLGLQGPFPRGLKNCTSMTGLDLSSNNFSGFIPPDVSQQVPFLTSLDLSYNGFSGIIPLNIMNMTYLNTINLQHNQLSGSVSGQFNLERLSSFNVADNRLSGPIPFDLGKKFLASRASLIIKDCVGTP